MKSEIYTVYSRQTMVTFQIWNSQTNTPSIPHFKGFLDPFVLPPSLKSSPVFCWGPGCTPTRVAVPLPPNCPTWSGGIGKDITLEVPRRIQGESFESSQLPSLRREMSGDILKISINQSTLPPTQGCPVRS